MSIYLSLHLSFKTMHFGIGFHLPFKQTNKQKNINKQTKSTSHAHNASSMFPVLVYLKWIKSLEILLKQFDFRLLTFYNVFPPIFYGHLAQN